MNKEEVLDLLRETGALERGHFQLSSGRHSDTYIEKFRLLERPDAARKLGAAIADRFAGEHIDVVLSPAVGAILLGFATALHLGARFIFAEREEGRMKLRRGFRIASRERVLVVEDVVTTGRSLMEVVELVSSDALAGIACLVDRSAGFRGPRELTRLATVEADSWAPDECPLCREGRPIDSPGSSRLEIR